MAVNVLTDPWDNEPDEETADDEIDIVELIASWDMLARAMEDNVGASGWRGGSGHRDCPAALQLASATIYLYVGS